MHCSAQIDKPRHFCGALWTSWTWPSLSRRWGFKHERFCQNAVLLPSRNLCACCQPVAVSFSASWPRDYIPAWLIRPSSCITVSASSISTQQARHPCHRTGSGVLSAATVMTALTVRPIKRGVGTKTPSRWDSLDFMHLSVKTNVCKESADIHKECFIQRPCLLVQNVLQQVGAKTISKNTKRVKA